MIGMKGTCMLLMPMVLKFGTYNWVNLLKFAIFVCTGEKMDFWVSADTCCM